MSGVPRAIEVENHDNDVNVLKLNLSDFAFFGKFRISKISSTMIHVHDSCNFHYIKGI